MLEVDSWIRNAQVFRLLSFMFAVIWNLVYLFAFLWLSDYIGKWDGREIGTSEMFVAMVIAYNLILHFGILPINFVIIFKELSMEWFQFLNIDAGTDRDDISLRPGEEYNDVDRLSKDLEWFDPDCWGTECSYEM